LIFQLNFVFTESTPVTDGQTAREPVFVEALNSSDSAVIVVVSTSKDFTSKTTLSPSLRINVVPFIVPLIGSGSGGGLSAHALTTTRNSLRVVERRISEPFDNVRYS